MISSRLGFRLEANGDRFGVAVFDGDAVALRAHGEGAGDHFRAVQLAEELAGFLFHLFFFVADEGDDIAENIERGHAGISRAAHGLHGHGHHGLEAERW